LLRRFGASGDPYVAERTARASLLLPAAEDELQAAVALAERAVATKATTAQWIYPYFLFALGLAEYRQGRFDSTISIMRADAGTVMGPAPRLVIAMAQYRKGQKEEARATLAAEIVRFDWGMAHAISRDHWIWHVLRREAEALILPNLPAFLEGKYQPRDNDERLALLGICQFKDLRRTEASLYAVAFEADPKRAEDLQTGLRHNAACAAAVASCGGGADAAGVSEEERSRWRKRAHAWLQADLDAWAKIPPSAPSAERARRQRLIRLWKFDPQLAGVRETSSLEKLPPEEREEWHSLWTNADALINHLQPATRTVPVSP